MASLAALFGSAGSRPKSQTGKVRTATSTGAASNLRQRRYAPPAKRSTSSRRSGTSLRRGSRSTTPNRPTPTARQRTSAPSTPRRTSAPSSPPQRNPGQIEPVTAPPKPPSIPEYLGADEVYQQALRGSRRSLADFLSDVERRRGEAGVSFEQTQQQLEEDRVRQLERMKDEFAARGLIHSGIYGKEQGRFQEAFQQQMQQLEQQQSSLLADFLSQETDFRRETEQAKEIARQEALMRRANRFDIPFNQGR